MTNRRWAMAAIAALAMAVPARASATETAQTLSLAVAQATVRKEERTGQSVLDIRLAPQSQAAFAEFTERHVGQRIALRADGRVLLAPTIREPIREGRLTISPGAGAGAMSPREMNDIAARLGSGAATIEVALQPGP